MPILGVGPGVGQGRAQGMQDQFGSQNLMVRQNVDNVWIGHHVGMGKGLGQQDFPSSVIQFVQEIVFIVGGTARGGNLFIVQSLDKARKIGLVGKIARD